jgi:signal transduction histidine kinase
MSDYWRLFPYPTTDRHNRVDGSLIPWPRICLGCQLRPCESDSNTDAVKTCVYGMDYIVIAPNRLLGGVIAVNLPTESQAHRKRKRQFPASHVKQSELLGAVERARSLDVSVAEAFAAERTRLLDEYLGSSDVHGDVMNEVRPQLERALQQSHDFLGLLKQITENVETIFELRYPGLEPHKAADRLENEGAIFYAAKLMLAKMDATEFLFNPNRALDREDVFSLHSHVLKYARIYQAEARQRGVDMALVGESYGRVRYNGDAVGVVIQAILDNAVKYAPSASNITIRFEESNSRIVLKVISLGPLIDPDERERVFLVGYRGHAARRQSSTGLGLGLASARGISDLLGLGIEVRQASTDDPSFPKYRETEFVLAFDRID